MSKETKTAYEVREQLTAEKVSDISKQAIVQELVDIDKRYANQPTQELLNKRLALLVRMVNSK